MKKLILVMLLLLGCKEESVVRYPFPLYPSQNNFKAQVEFYQKRLAQNPKSFLDWAELAAIHLRQAKSAGDNKLVDEAEKYVLKSKALMAKENHKADMLLAEIAETRHEFYKAIEIAQSIIAGDPRSIGAFATIVTSRLALGDSLEAGRAADTLIDLSPDTGSYALRALVNIARGRNDEAEYDFKKGLSLEDIGMQPTSAWVRSLFGRFYFSQGKYDLAEAYLNEALRLQPQEPVALGVIGDLALAKKDFKLAQQRYIAAFKATGAVLFLVKQGSALKASGQMAEADRIWTQAEAVIRDEMKSRYGHPHDLIALELERGRKEDLREAYRLAEQAALERKDAQALSQLAEAQFALGMNEPAWKTMRELLWSGIREPKYFDLAAKIRAGIGDRNQSELFRGLASKRHE